MGNQDSAKAKAFLEAAKKIDDFEVAITSSTDVIAENVAKDEMIVLLKNFDDPKTEFSGEFNGEEIKKWVDDNSVPLVWEFSQSTAQKIFKGTAKVHYIYFEEKKENFATGNVQLFIYFMTILSTRWSFIKFVKLCLYS